MRHNNNNQPDLDEKLINGIASFLTDYFVRT